MFFCGVYAQDEVVEKKTVVDSLYREDQFYFNVSFNNIQNAPSGLKQNKISSSLAFGFLRDMPINKSRTFSIAAGLGYTKNILNENLYTYDTSNSNNSILAYEIISSDIYYSKNRLTTHYIDLPIEIRWRNSTFESHKFWRIYTGFKLSYLIADNYKFANDLNAITIKNDPNLNKFQYGCYIASGWNSLNVYFYYGLNPIFKSTEVNGQSNKMNNFNLGFQFYVL
jgi:hypothetical protein